MKKDKNITKDKAEEIWYSKANDGYCGGINHQHYNDTRYHGINLHFFLHQRYSGIQTFQQHTSRRKNQSLYTVLFSGILHGLSLHKKKSYSVQWMDTHQNRKLQLCEIFSHTALDFMAMNLKHVGFTF